MADDYMDKTMAAYNATADQYEASTQSMVNEAEINLLISLLPQSSAPVLDAGCAYGRDSAYLNENGISTIGVDLSTALVSRAKTNYPQLNFQLMDVRKLDFPAATFRGIYCNAVLLHLNDTDLPKALVQFRRVLVPGGVIAVSFKQGKGSGEVVEKFSSSAARYYNFKSESAVNRLVQDAGFQVEKSYVLNERERFGPDKRDLNWVWCFARKAAHES